MRIVVDDLDVVIVSYESRDFLVRSIEAWAKTPVRPVVVDNASADGSADAARDLGVEVLQLETNVGFGSAANAGIEHGSRPFVLVANADAWPGSANDVDALVDRVRGDTRIGAAGPSFVGVEGEPQPTLLPAASRWWMGHAAVSSFPDDPRSRSRPPREQPSFLIGAAILFRRATLAEVGAFDPAFFLFNEEVDLCLRIADHGWRLTAVAESRFVHVGGVSTRPRWSEAYREQLRGHLRLLDKREGRRVAEQARRWLAASLALRARFSSEEQRRFLRSYAVWLRRSTVADLLAEQSPVRNGPGSE